MPSASLLNYLNASVEFKSYSEKVDYSAEGKPEPNVGSQTLIYRSNASQWWISVYSTQNEQTVKHNTSKKERRNEFQTFPHDTEVIRKELENLKLFRNVLNIVQAVGIAASTNPYITSSTKDQPPIVTGIVLEYCSGGYKES
ncbi:hypothetical protein AJ78_02968 [Emergomyces pasteurianus Ep9510]|uniref:Protein kinase domain-containing protein n=1 Tax=Emergomyces pasteurianus Ep9510 TaxID=1447872 RepID=A0A1J9Q9L1_9EURO|nr:hypothetical protein AJ78_02968 [Emergomyces pasteurianus Ep9510]